MLYLPQCLLYRPSNKLFRVCNGVYNRLQITVAILCEPIPQTIKRLAYINTYVYNTYKNYLTFKSADFFFYPQSLTGLDLSLKAFKPKLVATTFTVIDYT